MAVFIGAFEGSEVAGAPGVTLAGEDLQTARREADKMTTTVQPEKEQRS
jgi:hypothetical protein